jgi:hypothetical protein
MADEVDTQDTETEGPKQTIKRLPPDRDVGPFFPSGMSAPEAAMAGATANLTDEEKEKVDEMAAEYGVGEAAPE